MQTAANYMQKSSSGQLLPKRETLNAVLCKAKAMRNELSQLNQSKIAEDGMQATQALFSANLDGVQSLNSECMSRRQSQNRLHRDFVQQHPQQHHPQEQQHLQQQAQQQLQQPLGLESQPQMQQKQETLLEHRPGKLSPASLPERRPRCGRSNMSYTALPGSSGAGTPAKAACTPPLQLASRISFPRGGKGFSTQVPPAKPAERSLDACHRSGTASPCKAHFDGREVSAQQAANGFSRSRSQSGGYVPPEMPPGIRPLGLVHTARSPVRSLAGALSGTHSPAHTPSHPSHMRSAAASGAASPSRRGSLSPHSLCSARLESPKACIAAVLRPTNAAKSKCCSLTAASQASGCGSFDI